MSSPDIEITYFNIEGAAEKVRLALTLQSIPFKDNRIGRDEWMALKPNTKFGQLPLMSVDGGEAMAQSGAMLRFAGHLGDGSLYPAENLLAIEEAIGLAEDFQRAWMPNLYIGMRPEAYGYPEGFNKTEDGQAKVKEMREKFVATEMPKFMKFFTNQLEANGGEFFAGKLSIADCMILPALRAFQRGHIDHVPVTCLDEYPPSPRTSRG